MCSHENDRFFIILIGLCILVRSMREEKKDKKDEKDKKDKKDKKKRKKSKKHHSDAVKIPMEDEPATTQSTTLAADIGGSNSTAPSTGSTVFNLNVRLFGRLKSS